MTTKYKVISDWFCLTAKHKAKKIESHLNRLSPAGWKFVALDPVIFLGFDIGYYLVLSRSEKIAGE
jgi:hypothetical protein